MNFKRFLTVLVLSTLVLGVLAFNTVDASNSADDEGWGKTPTRTKTLTPTTTRTPTPTDPNSNSNSNAHSQPLRLSLFPPPQPKEAGVAKLIMDLCMATCM